MKKEIDNCILAKKKLIMKKKIKEYLLSAIDNYQLLLNAEIINKIDLVVNTCTNLFSNDNKLLLCGNGGSAADAQHIAAELSGRFKKDRKPLFAEALHTNSSYMTAVSNDYGYERTYERLIDAKGREGDMLFAFSTSGNSQNIINAIIKAKQKKIFIVGFTGKSGGKMKNLCDVIFNVPSKDTPRIQEAHILFGHIISELIEEKLFS